MLQQAILLQLQPQMIDPEQWFVSQGRLQARNPDNTPPAERAALVKKFLVVGTLMKIKNLIG